MRKDIHIFLFFLCTVLSVSAQQTVVDSLLTIVRQSKQDTTKVNALNELFLQYEFSDSEKAKGYLDEALQLSNKRNFKRGLATTHIYLGYFAEDKADYASAIIQYQTALKLFVLLSNNDGILKVFNNIGNVYFLQSQYKQALANYTECLKIGLETGNQKGILNAYNNIGLVWSTQADYSKALPNFFASLKCSIAMDDKAEIIKSYNYIGSIYSDLGNYSEALKYYLLGLKMGESTGGKKEISKSYICLGNLYTAMGNNSEALKYHKLSLEIVKILDDRRGLAYCYNNIGNVYLETGQYEEALKYDFQCLALAGELQDLEISSYVYNNIGLAYYKQALNEKNGSLRNSKLKMALENQMSSLKLKEGRGDKSGMASSYNIIGSVYFLQKEYSKARKYMLLGKEFAKKTGFKDYLQESYYELQQLDSAQGNYKGAYENHKMYILYRDSLDNEETRKKTIQAQMTYDFEKKEAVAEAEHKKELENQELIANEKSHKQKIILLLVSCFLLFVVVFAGFVFRSLRNTRKQKDIIEAQKNLVETQKIEVERQKSIVEEHQKEIIDSIVYARRIQRSLLPTESYIEKNLNRLKK